VTEHFVFARGNSARPFALLALIVVMTAGGCASMTPGRMAAVQTESDRPRAGNVYLLRGWIGIFSYGINDLGKELNAQGVRANVYQDDQWSTLAEAIKGKYGGRRNAEPLILIGHSFGADDVLRVSSQLAEANITVDLVVTLDPVTPPDVPANVRRCVNLYQSNGAWDKVPAFRGVPLKLVDGRASRTQLENLDVRKDRTDLLEPGTDHFNIEKKAKIHAEVVRRVLATCPPREQWARLELAEPDNVVMASATALPKRTEASGPTTQPAQALARPPIAAKSSAN
jgi:pimeloyl-ACP methyl ester carboxylesterase